MPMNETEWGKWRIERSLLFDPPKRILEDGGKPDYRPHGTLFKFLIADPSWMGVSSLTIESELHVPEVEARRATHRALDMLAKDLRCMAFFVEKEGEKWS